MELLQEVDPRNYNGRLLRSIAYFVKGRDVGAAISEVRKCREEIVDDPTWRYNYAFLLAYRGELPQALKQYQVAARKKLDSRVILQVEAFLLWVIDEEPEHVELHFCLGVINHLAKDDPVRALEEFEGFLAKADRKDRRNKEAVRRTESFIRELRHKLGSERRRYPEEVCSG